MPYYKKGIYRVLIEEKNVIKSNIIQIKKELKKQKRKGYLLIDFLN
jgi:hypothetical protein